VAEIKRKIPASKENKVGEIARELPISEKGSELIKVIPRILRSTCFRRKKLKEPTEQTRVLRIREMGFRVGVGKLKRMKRPKYPLAPPCPTNE
jgi:hypothetical protein